MHIAIDAREACKARPTGKGRWSHCFIEELLRRRVHDLTILTDADCPLDWRKFAAVVRLPAGMQWHLHAANWAGRSNAIYVSPTSYIVPAFAMSRARTIPVVHDLIALHDEPHDRKARLIERWTLPRAILRAVGILAISETTSSVLHKRFTIPPSIPVTTIYAGPASRVLTRNESERPSIVCLGTLCPRKNQLRLIQAFNRLPDPLRRSATLILVGARGWADKAIVAAARSTPNVEWRGYMDDDAWAQLLSRATLLAFPSLEEGFGLPILDAFRQGVPVLTSDRGSMKEVAADAALLVDPEDVDSITGGLQSLLSDRSLRDAYAIRGIRRSAEFTWSRTVDRALQAIEDLPSAVVTC